LIKEGDNSVEIAVMRTLNDDSYLNYRLAIEVIGVKSHEKIKETCLTTKVLPEKQVLDAIKAKLSTTEDDDDEIAIVQSNLLINLCDPFSTFQICNTPARGKLCPHNNCFDLDTFLRTRMRKGGVSLPDMWRCPICGADARPDNLVVDGFLQEVHTELRAKGLLQTRAIVVNADGSWGPKVERNEALAGEPASLDGTSDPVAAAMASIRRSASVADFIHLDD
jgi:hypothetical protein